MLMLDNKYGQYIFVLTSASDFGDMGLDNITDIPSGIEINGTFDDPIGELLNLKALFERAFPGCEFSTAFDD